jgi:hypothetical protein
MKVVDLIDADFSGLFPSLDESTFVMRRSGVRFISPAPKK